MSNDEKSFLGLRTLPARLNPEQAAWYLGCNFESITVLIAAGLLKPLGRPANNAGKFFSLAELEQLRVDTKWLSRATDAIQSWHRRKNRRGLVAPSVSPRQPLSQLQRARPEKPINHEPLAEAQRYG